MERKVYVIFLLQLFISLISAYDPTPYIILYSEYDQTGDYVFMTSEQSALATIGFDDRTKSYCGTGLWFLYEDAYYAQKSEFIEEFSGGMTCTNVVSSHENKITSVRFAGAADVTMDSLTMYECYKMACGEFLVVRDVSYIGLFDNKASSFAVVGNSSWTVYKDYDYTGASFCLEPSRSVSGIYYGLWEPNDVGLPNDSISSARKGCHSSTVFRYEQNE